MYRLVLLSLAVAGAVASPLAGQTNISCVQWTKFDEFLSFYQNSIHNASAEFITIPDYEFNALGFGVAWKNGKAGNFSSLATSGTVPQLCTNGDTKTLIINLGFQDLKLGFDDFVVATPIFSLDASPTFQLEGENLLAEISATVNGSTCNASLDKFLFNDWGSMSLNMGDGIINWIVNKIFNSYISNYFLSALKMFGVGATINKFALKVVNAYLTEHPTVVCAILNM